MRGLAFLAILAFASPALAADIYESKTGYSIIYSDDWKIDEQNTTENNVALTCVYELCQGTVRASIMAEPAPRYKDDPPSKLFVRAYPQIVSVTLEENSKKIGKVKELILSKRHRIGNVEGFLGTFNLQYFDNRQRHVIYAMVLNHGYFYHIQILSPEVPNADIQKRIDELLDGFQVSQSE